MQRGVSDSSVLSVEKSDSDSTPSAWMPFYAPPSLFDALRRRYGAGARDSTSLADGGTYYFEFFTGTVSLSLPEGAHVIPKPPSDSVVRSKVFF